MLSQGKSLAGSFFPAIVAKMGSNEQIATALETWAGAKFGADSKVDALTRLSGGASQETWAFDVVTDKGKTPLILRRAPGGVEAARSSEAIGLAMEATLLTHASKAGVPVPPVLGVFENDPDLGQCFVMDRIRGETLGRKILRDDEYAAARNVLARQCGEALAGIHSISPDTLPDLPVSNGINQLEKYEAIYRAFKLPRPVFELAFSWLKANAPEPLPVVLVHGDFRLGNLMVSEKGLASVLDWELAHIGDPREDIAWLCVNSWRFGNVEKRVGGFGDLPDLLDAYATAGGATLQPRDIDWWEIMGSLKWGIMCMIMYEAYRSGADPSVERAAIGRRVSETEIDLVNLLEGIRNDA
ncbi:phosphotransferase enzyme family protein [Hyphomonas jannaschiana VP2]|uniref:Phosphotransferase enzyme family protein n=2 Tax=Hyphomonadaceae TaxID=69657 RepID=A0A059FB47_9PROT|nr:phosphotransferase enzyme family protein [Hyphomonas jannaschiana VP2]